MVVQVSMQDIGVRTRKQIIVKEGKNMEFKQIKSKFDIREYDKYTRQEPTVENARKWLSKYLNNENFAVCVEGKNFDGFVVNAFKEYQIRLEKDIRDYIKSEYKQEAIPIGTKIELTEDYGKYPKGHKTEILKVTRFGDDTFGHGWYIYETTDHLTLYVYEFEVI